MEEGAFGALTTLTSTFSNSDFANLTPAQVLIAIKESVKASFNEVVIDQQIIELYQESIIREGIRTEVGGAISHGLSEIITETETLSRFKYVPAEPIKGISLRD